MRVCSNCKRQVLNPIDHEFCKFKMSPAEAAQKIDTRTREQKVLDGLERLNNNNKFSTRFEVESGGERPHYRSKEPMPEQKPIVHDVAPKGARAPKYGHDTYTGNFAGKDELTDDSYAANARNIFEGL